MTKEQRILFDLPDIRSIIFECRKCGGRYGVPIEKPINAANMAQCPFCAEDWMPFAHADNAYVEFMSKLRALRHLQENGRDGFCLRLEVDGEPPAPKD